jgi:hypothetical protein
MSGCEYVTFAVTAINYRLVGYEFATRSMTGGMDE